VAGWGNTSSLHHPRENILPCLHDSCNFPNRDVALLDKLGIVFKTCLTVFTSFQSGQLNEYTERKEMSSDVQCMALGTVPAGEQRSRFLAIGLSDNTVRVISLDPQDCLQPLSMQALPAMPESLCIVEMAMGGLESESGRLGGLFLNIGLSVCCCCFISHVFVWSITGAAIYS